MLKRDRTFVGDVERLLESGSYDAAAQAIGRRLAASMTYETCAALLSAVGTVADRCTVERAARRRTAPAVGESALNLGRLAALAEVLDAFLGALTAGAPTNLADQIVGLLADSRERRVYPSDLVARLDTSKAQVTRALQILEEHGYVETDLDALGDRRRRPRRLTDLGHSYATTMARS